MTRSGIRLVALGLVAATVAACAVDTVVAPSTPGVEEQACLAAVSEQTANGDVAVLSADFSEANSVVMVGVGPDRAPWRCLVSNDGVVSEVMSMTDEGAL